MKKLYSLLRLIIITSVLAGCGEKECKPNIVEKEVVVDNIVEKEVIKEVPVTVEKSIKPDYVRKYRPGTYYRECLNDDGSILKVVVVVDLSGRVTGVNFDLLEESNKFKYDEENNKLYYYVQGIEDVIPNTYRLVDLDSKLPTIQDYITTNDLIEGYPSFDEKINRLVSLTTPILKSKEDKISDDYKNTYSYETKLIADKIINDQTTYGINLYETKGGFLTNAIDDVNLIIHNELKLVQDILNNEAKYDGKVELAKLDDKKGGLYKPGSYYNTSEAVLNEGKLSFVTTYLNVNDNGKISGAFIDIIDEKGSRYTNDEMTRKELDKISHKIVEANGVGLVELVDDNNQEAKLNLATKNGKFIDEVYFKDSNLSANIIMKTLNNSLKDKSLIDLKEGAYYNTDDFGNMISIIVKDVITDYDLAVVRRVFDNLTTSDLEKIIHNLNEVYPFNSTSTNLITNKEYLRSDLTIGSMTDSSVSISDILVIKPEIISISLDSLEEVPAKIKVDGSEFPLYTYDKGSLDLALEEVKTKTLIYFDGKEYYYATNQGINRGYEKGDKVKFDYSGYDELATIKELTAYTTSNCLNNEKSKEMKDFKDKFIKTLDYSCLVDSNNKNYYDLLLDTLALASVSDNSSKNIASIDDTNLVSKMSFGNGTYTRSNVIPNVDGTTKFVTIHVIDGKLSYLFVDETVLVDGKLSTKASLANKYTVDSKFNYDKDSKLSYQDSSFKLSDSFNESLDDLENKILKDYDYELKTTLDEDYDLLKNDSELYEYNSALEEVVLASLQEAVNDKLKNLESKLIYELKDKFVLASGNKGAITVYLNDSDLSLLNEKLDLNLDTDSKALDIKDDKGYLNRLNEFSKTKTDEEDVLVARYIFEADLDEDIINEVAKINYSISYDDYQEVNGSIDLAILTSDSYKQRLLDGLDKTNTSLNDTLAFGKSSIVNNQEFSLLLKDEVFRLNSLDRLDSKANKNILFSLDGLDDKLNLALVSMPILINQVEATLTVTDDKYQLTNDISINDALIFKTLGFKLVAKKEVSKDTPFSIDTNNFDYYDLASNQKVDKANFDDLLSIKSKTVLPTGTVIKPSITSDSAKLNLTITCFIDNYENKDNELNVYQKGEASKTFDITVYSNNEAYKEIKNQIKLGTVRDEVSGSTVIDVIDNNDLTIYGTSISLGNSLMTLATISDSDDIFNNSNISAYAKCLGRDGKVYYALLSNYETYQTDNYLMDANLNFTKTKISDALSSKLIKASSSFNDLVIVTTPSFEKLSSLMKFKVNDGLEEHLVEKEIVLKEKSINLILKEMKDSLVVFDEFTDAKRISSSEENEIFRNSFIDRIKFLLNVVMPSKMYEELAVEVIDMNGKKLDSEDTIQMALARLLDNEVSEGQTYKVFFDIKVSFEDNDGITRTFTKRLGTKILANEKEKLVPTSRTSVNVLLGYVDFNFYDENENILSKTIIDKNIKHLVFYPDVSPTGNNYVITGNEDNKTLSVYSGEKFKGFRPVDQVDYEFPISYPNNEIKGPGLRNFLAHSTSLETIDFNDCFDISEVVSTAGMFFNCSNLVSIKGMDSMDFSKVIDFSDMFYMCKNLKEVRSFEESKSCRFAREMFKECHSLEAGPEMDTSNAVEVRSMFEECHKVKYIPGYDFRSTTSLSNFAKRCNSLEDAPRFKNTDNVTNMTGIFSEAFRDSVSRSVCLDFSSLNATELKDYFSYEPPGYVVSNQNQVPSMIESLVIGEKFGLEKTSHINYYGGNNEYTINNIFKHLENLETITILNREFDKRISDTNSGWYEILPRCMNAPYNTDATSRGYYTRYTFSNEIETVDQLYLGYDIRGIKADEKSLIELDPHKFISEKGNDISLAHYIKENNIKELYFTRYLAKDNLHELLQGLNIPEPKDENSLAYYKSGDKLIIYTKAYNRLKLVNTEDMFNGCDTLTTVRELPVILSNATEVTYDSELFYFNEFEEMNIDRMFKDCKNLKEINLPFMSFYKVKNLRNCFEGCTNLEKVVLPVPFFYDYNLTGEIKDVFKGCDNLKRIIATNTVYNKLKDDLANSFSDKQIDFVNGIIVIQDK